jgi:hypothetical protein
MLSKLDINNLIESIKAKISRLRKDITGDYVWPCQFDEVDLNLKNGCTERRTRKVPTGKVATIGSFGFWMALFLARAVRMSRSVESNFVILKKSQVLCVSSSLCDEKVQGLAVLK